MRSTLQPVCTVYNIKNNAMYNVGKDGNCLCEILVLKCINIKSYYIRMYNVIECHYSLSTFCIYADHVCAIRCQ